MNQEEIIISFPVPLPGFPELSQFRLFEPPGGYPLKFLESLEEPSISFVCIDVAAIKPDYEVPLDDEAAEVLALENPSEALVLALVVIPQDPRRMTANLAGPLIVNIKTLIGRQVILNPEKFPLKHRVFPEN